MSISSVSALSTYQAASNQPVKNQHVPSSTTSAQKAAQQPKTDTVTISRQAKTLLTNSKTYTPAEEAAETGAEKHFEAIKGQR